METGVIIKNQTIRLQGMLAEGSVDRCVVVTHPHPLYGGNMDNPVVVETARAFVRKGFTTLRFNFRGTGGSTGMYDNGQGEQSDVIAALDFLRERGGRNLCLAGYSFGSRINASVVARGVDISDHIMISPPVAFMSFDDIDTLPLTGLIVTGKNDDIAPPKLIQTHIYRWRIAPHFEILSKCDHFYSGCLDQLQKALLRYIP